MSKSIYSLVLSEEIINEIDRIAYAEGTSRSALVNRILAEKLSYITPAMQTRDVLSRVAKLLSADVFRPIGEPTDTAFQLRSALSYKYNPTVRYSVVLNNDGNYLGELRVTVRSRSDGFTLTMLQFFRLWEKLESIYIGSRDYGAACCIVEPNRFTRRLIPHRRTDGKRVSVDAGEAIAAYLSAFDGGMKAFFSNLSNQNPAAASEAAERHIAEYMARNAVIL